MTESEQSVSEACEWCNREPCVCPPVEAHTSYEISWVRDPVHQPRPDFNMAPDALRFYAPSGKPLFTVVTHGGPSEGIFTLIAEAPRLRDELNQVIGGTRS